MFQWILFPCMKNGILREIDEEKCNVASMRYSAVQKCFNLWKKHKKLFFASSPSDPISLLIVQVCKESGVQTLWTIGHLIAITAFNKILLDLLWRLFPWGKLERMSQLYISPILWFTLREAVMNTGYASLLLMNLFFYTSCCFFF